MTNSSISSYGMEEMQRYAPQADTILNTANVKIGVNMAIADAGVGKTSHFLVAGAPVGNKQITANPLTINLLDGAQL